MNKHEVTQVNECLPVGQSVLTNSSQRNHGLNASTITSLHGSKAELTGVTNEHNTTGYTNDLTGFIASLKLIFILGTNLIDAVSYRHTNGVRLAARFNELRTLFHANLHLL